METPVQITFRGVPVDDEIERLCRKEVEKLERYHDRITGCHVVIAQPHRRHRHGNLFQVSVDLVVPGAEIAVNRVPSEHEADEKLELALREAFDTARRRLEDHVRRQRGLVKSHETPAHGRVSRLDVVRGGSLTTPDGRELDFAPSGVRGAAFDELEVGMEVTYHEERGAGGGSRAARVCPVGRHGHRLP
jgi:ribosome-associated translation inhibitor RaiA